MSDRPTYRLTLRPEPGPVPEFVRLRRCLKALLRCYGLRLLSLDEVAPRPPEPPPAQAPAQGPTASSATEAPHER